ncbi:hypothetical protein AB7W84_20295 [Providencia rettgeri]
MDEEKGKKVNSIFGVLKKYLVYALKISPIYMVFSVIVIWGYLEHFSRLDLLVGALENKTNLFSIFSSFIFISVFMSFAFILPSFNLILLSSFVKSSYIKGTERMPYITFITIMIMLISVFILSSDAFYSFVKNYEYIESVLFYMDEPSRSLTLSFMASMISVIIFSKVKNSHKYIYSGVSKAIKVINSVIITSIVCFFPPYQ